jgi:hypothetical protein
MLTIIFWYDTFHFSRILRLSSLPVWENGVGVQKVWVSQSLAQGLVVVGAMHSG